ncbi:MalY/PatB family protein [Lachnospiraceae bacterium LCP25S3_G4]
MSIVTYQNRKGTNCSKWDAQTALFGEEHLHPMWVADMDFQVPTCVTQALHTYLETSVLGYYAIPDSYYNAFIHWEAERHNYYVSKDWIRFSPGVVPAINWFIQMLTQPQDSILTFTPVYYPFINSITNNNRTLITSELTNVAGVYSINMSDFEAKIVQNHVRMFILCSPHNPVGRVWTRTELEGILSICKKHHVYVISDEIHQDITFHPHKQVPSATVGDYDEILISLTAASKTFNLAACQNAFVIIPDKLLRETFDSFVQNLRILSGNAMGYVAVEAAYMNGKIWLEEVKEIIYKNYEFIVDYFSVHLPKVIISPLEGTYLLWLDFSAYLDGKDLKDFMQKKCKLALDYGDWFGGSHFQNHVRMNLATSLENVEKAANVIVQHLQ